MDIKGLARNIFPVGSPKASESARSKTDANNDREGNGQSSQGEAEQRRALTPEEIQDAIKYLESLGGVKDNGLTVRLGTADGVTVVYVEDRDGKVVRRIPEAELRALTLNRDKKADTF